MTDDQQTTAPEQRRSALGRWGSPSAFGAAGLAAGGLLAGSLTASAADSGSTTTPATGAYSAGSQPGRTGNADQSQPQRSDEQLLTGTTADKVEAAALAMYPGATVARIETDSDGVYEAHLATANGTPVTVEIDKSFTVTGTEVGGPGGGGPAGGAGPSTTSGSGAAASGYAA
ncbi:MAG: hypothetical protein ABI807_00665 [Sporichthyaceae bacterium]